jgi:hypothetical protein
MVEPIRHSHTSDICLLLRAYAEQRWLSHELVPVLRELEQLPSLAEEQLGAALAYLEVLWIEASQRGAETDAAYAELQRESLYEPPPLSRKACSYHGAVLRLREALARHVAELLAFPSAGSLAPSGPSPRQEDRIRSAGCRRRASTSNRIQPTPTARFQPPRS